MVILSRQEKPVMFSNFVIEKINHASMVSKIDYRRDTNVNYIFSLKFRECDDKGLACMR